MSVEVYGKLFDLTEMEEAVTDTLQVWLPAYVAEIERQRGITPRTIPLPRSWGHVNEFYKFTEEQLPSVIVVSPGTAASEPKQKGDGSYHSWYRVGVAVVAAGRDRETTRRISKLYVAAVRGAILQHQTLGDFGAEGIRWMGDRNQDVPDEQGRTLGSGAVMFDVEVKDVINSRFGPLTPPDDPYANEGWPHVTSVDVKVTDPSAQLGVAGVEGGGGANTQGG